MLNEATRSFISNLEIGAPSLGVRAEDDASPVSAVDINNLPNGIVTGSNLIAFPPDASPAVRTSVTLSLLAAQRVASNDQNVGSPADWIARHNEVLEKLNWRKEKGGNVDAEFETLDVAVHKAIIPFLAAAFGGALAGPLILTALNQLNEMDKDSPWITLFDRQSRHFDVTEYQFSVVEVKGDQVSLKLASARLDAFKGRTQVLFVKVTEEHAKFESASQCLVADVTLLEDMNGDLRTKLAGFTKAYIQSLPI